LIRVVRQSAHPTKKWKHSSRWYRRPYSSASGDTASMMLERRTKVLPPSLPPDNVAAVGSSSSNGSWPALMAAMIWSICAFAGSPQPPLPRLAAESGPQ
jgi:hypothetical protein